MNHLSHTMGSVAPYNRDTVTVSPFIKKFESDLAKFSPLLGFRSVFYACPPIDEETLCARAPRVSARADVTNGPGARRRARTPSFA